IPLLKGRTFTLHDDLNSPPVVIVDEEFVGEYFRREDAIGKLVANNGHGDFAVSRDHPATVIGVVGNVATRELGSPPRPEIYWPPSVFTARSLTSFNCTGAKSPFAWRSARLRGLSLASWPGTVLRLRLQGSFPVFFYALLLRVSRKASCSTSRRLISGPLRSLRQDCSSW